MKEKFLKNKMIFITLIVFGIIHVLIEWHRQGDFYIFLNAGQLINNKVNIYGYNDLSDFKYFYSPLFAWVLSFFSGFEYAYTFALWKLLNLYFLYRIWMITFNHFLDLSTYSEKKKNIFIFIAILCNLFLLVKNFQGLQMSAFLIYAIMEGVYQIMYKKNKIGGAFIIALAINIKIMPLVIIPYLIFRKEFGGVLYIVGFFIVFLYLPGLFIGFDYNTFLLSEWWATINPTNKEHVLDVGERGLHSISTLVATLFSEDMDNIKDLQLKRNIGILSSETIGTVINLLRIMFISSALLILKWTPFRKEKDRLKVFAEISLVLMVTPIIFPHQQIYGFLFVMPAVIYCLYVIYQDELYKTFNFRFFLFCLSIFVISLPLLFGFGREYFQHFKSLSYGVILLWFSFLILFLTHKSNPNKIS